MDSLQLSRNAARITPRQPTYPPSVGLIDVDNHHHQALVESRNQLSDPIPGLGILSAFALKGISRFLTSSHRSLIQRIPLFQPKPKKYLGQDSCVVITGASRGIGATLAEELSGYSKGTLVLVARTETDLLAVQKKIKKNGTEARIIILPLDLSQASSAEELKRKLAELNLIPSALVLNAGIASDKSFLKTTEKESERIMNINYTTPRAIMRQYATEMNALGKIIVVGSMASITGFPGNADYAASRGAMHSFIRSFAMELKNLAKKGTSVADLHYVTLGQVRTSASEKFRRAYLPSISPQEAAKILSYVIMTDSLPSIITPGTLNKLIAWGGPFFASAIDMMMAGVGLANED